MKLTRILRSSALGLLTVLAAVVLGLTWMRGASAQRVPALSEADAALLQADLEADGAVSVIVGVDVPFSPQAALQSKARADAQQAAIDAARADLLTTLNAIGAAAVVSASDEWVIPFVALDLDAPAYAALQVSPEVVSIKPNIAVPPLLSSSIPIVQADQLTGMGFTGAGYTVAVLDTGTLATHTAFGGRVVAEACYSGASGSTTLCPNLATTQTGAGAASPSRCLTLFSGSSDCSHGTHVSSTSVGGSAEVTGVAPGANLIAVNVFSRIAGQGRPLSFTSDQISGLNYVYDLRNTYAIVSVNMSLGGGLYTSYCDDESPSLHTTFDLLRAAGIMPVISAGNDGSTSSISAPACHSNVVSVGSTTDLDLRSGFSNSLPSIMVLFAPGSNILAAFAGSTTQTAAISGTSMAAPHVAGAFALLKSAVPGKTVEEILTAMRNTGQPITVPGGTTPRIKLHSAYLALSDQPTPTPSITPTNSPPPANDLYTGAFPITIVPGTRTQTDIHRAGATGEPVFSCGTPSNIVWYSFSQSTGSSHGLTITTVNSEYDTIMAVFTNPNPASPAQVVCNDDINFSVGNYQSSVSFNAASGTTYYIGIGEYDTADIGEQTTLRLNITSPTLTIEPTPTYTPTNTLTPINSPTPSNTPMPSNTPTLTPTPILLQLTLQGRPTAPHAAYSIAVDVEITRLSDNQVMYSGSHTSDNDGRFNIPPLAAETYRVRVKNSTTLASVTDITVTSGGTFTLAVLREGDGNDNNQVTIADFSILAATFGKASGQPGFDARADFNRDGVVSVSDFALLAANFGQSGAG